MLPDGQCDPVQYCQMQGIQNLRIIKLLSKAHLEEEFQRISLTDKTNITVVVEVPVEDRLNGYIDSQLDDSLVTPSALYLNGSHTPVNRSVCWRMVKHQGRFTRHGAEEGIIQWGHLLKEISFCLGQTPKYGD